MIRFKSTVHNTVHAYAAVPASDIVATTRRIAAQSRGNGATGPALRKVVTDPDGTGTVLIHVAYRSA